MCYQIKRVDLMKRANASEGHDDEMVENRLKVYTKHV